jgi:hypothetical protein
VALPVQRHQVVKSDIAVIMVNVVNDKSISVQLPALVLNYIIAMLAQVRWCRPVEKELPELIFVWAVRVE